jgi:sugar O-acyltransferase (sialic acid O-acetyltransferase NeuD family)
MKNLVLFGSGGFAREVHQLVEDINAISPSIHVLGFLDEARKNHGQKIHGLEVLGGVEWLLTSDATDVFVVVCIGNTASKKKVISAIKKETGARFLSLIHPRAWIGNRVEIGDGSIICAGSLITTDITIGQHVIVNIGTTIGHDAIIDNFVTIAPTVNISGAVHVEEGVDLGTGCVILQAKTVGQWSVLGAGAVVINDIDANVTAVGAPAKAVKSRPVGWHLG